jgi:hypothetical protein
MTERILVSDVPLYLRVGEFFSALEETEDEAIEVPVGVTKKDTNINSIDEMREVLMSLRFWMVDVVPHSLMEYVVLSSDVDVHQTISEFQSDLRYLFALWDIRSASCDSLKLVFAIRTARIEVLRRVRDMCAASELEHIHLVSAARYGDLQCLQFVYAEARRCDNLVCEGGMRASTAAAKYGNLSCLKYLHACGEQLADDACVEAAKGGNLACLQYLYNCKCPWSATTTAAAAWSGHLQCLQYAHELGCAWDATACAAAAGGGHEACLRYLHERGCPWDTRTCSAAAGRGMLSCLIYAREHGCPFDASACAAAASAGHLDCLKYLHERSCPWDATACAKAGKGGHLPCLTYAHESGCAWGSSTCIAAALGGHVLCVKYALENGCDASGREIMRAASRCGSLACLQLGDERGLQWDHHCTMEASRRGHVECLRFLLNRGCPVRAVALQRGTAEARELLTGHSASRWLTFTPDELLRGVLSEAHHHLLHEPQRKAKQQERPLQLYTYNFSVDHLVLKLLTVFHHATSDPAVDTLVLLQHLLEVIAQSSKPEKRVKLLHLVRRFGNEQCFAYAVRDCQPPRDYEWVTSACERDMPAMLRMLFDHGWSADWPAARAAARCGSLECLRCLFEEKGELDSPCYTAALEGNHLAVVQYLHSVNTPWTGDFCERAVERGNLQCLQFAHEHGCAFSPDKPLYMSYLFSRWPQSVVQCAMYYIERGGRVESKTLTHLQDFAQVYRMKWPVVC